MRVTRSSSRARGAVAVAVVLAAAYPGCSSGSESGSASSGGSSGAAGSGGAAGAPDAGDAGHAAGSPGVDAGADAPPCDCVTAPPGWSGPFEGRVDATARYCESGEVPVVTLYDDLVSEAENCRCQCAGAVDCTSVRRVGYDAIPCVTEIDAVELPLDDCVELPPSGAVGARIGPGLITGSCVPVARALSSPTPLWTRTLSLCQPARDCSAGVCVDQAGGDACVVRAGDHECPAGFPSQDAWYDDWDDQRECDDTNCSCGPPYCVGNALFFQGPACTGDSDVVSIPRGCQSPPPGLSARLYNALADCEGLGASQTVGEAVPIGRHTVCCR